MTNAIFPQTIFTTQRRFNDYGASDMRHGNLSEARLKSEFGLTTISNVVDPYSLTRLTAFNNPQARFSGAYGGVHRGGKVSIQECARLLFKEMQITSLPFSFVGPYRHLINQMLRHFQRASGSPFNDAQLNAAYRNKIISENSAECTKTVLKKIINDLVDYTSKGIPSEKMNIFKKNIKTTRLPKFDSFLNKINGMGITVHDVHATRIDILSLDVNEKGWKASVRFTAQDHFGLDAEDIRKQKFNQFQFFRIWFILQHFNKFGFRPFLTNMEAVITIGGER
ncbi:DUF3289 family protein [Erwinia mallotivora]|uniref:DUF3289 domain-containing protein n=1 Tax=Erwinia mallotivora TaxID=69222 RepID=A0A014MDJ2_9GAMM|nr:DUF3289 family protein [Erwinia mallotivora]EXU76124.1 hypothetical protein BG55_07120 [Erwinia mallotivora]